MPKACNLEFSILYVYICLWWPEDSFYYQVATNVFKTKMFAFKNHFVLQCIFEDHFNRLNNYQPVIISCPKDKRKICLILKCFNWIWENYFWRKFVEVIICSERLNAQEALPNSKTPFYDFPNTYILDAFSWFTFLVICSSECSERKDIKIL